jgi:nucleotide-binding universal stress UspA family protein
MAQRLATSSGASAHPAEHSEETFMSTTRIVVGVDGSSESKTALDWAIDLATDTETSVVAVHATELGLSSMFPSATGPDYDEMRQQLEQVVRDEWCHALAVADVPSEVVIQDGGPALVLIAVADRVDARTIVVGPRGEGGSPGLPLGSVGFHLAQYANRPVTIVRDAQSPAAL